MGWRFPRLGLPLLAKELSEVAARRRTYWVRGVAAGLLLAVFAAAWRASQRQGGGGLAGLGSGEKLFEGLLLMLFGLLYVLLPGMLSGVVTEEKERGSFPLLLLTGLGPWGILAAKLAGRLVPALTLVCLCLPLCAMAYGLGGVRETELMRAAWLLLLAAFYLAAIGLFASTVAASSLASFLLAYGIVAALAFGPPLVAEPLVTLLGLTGDLQLWLDYPRLFFVPYVMFASFPAPAGLEETLLRSMPALVAALFFLLLARLCLLRRAFVRPRPLLPRVLALLDRWMDAANRRLGGGVVLVRDSGALPGRDPIAWRETARRPLGQLRNFLRVTLALTVPAFLLACGSFVLLDDRQAEGAVRAILYLTWIVALLVLAAQGAGAFATERTHQTLELLLATPIAARDIVKQKARGLRRSVLALAIPLVALYLLQAFKLPEYGGRPTYLASALACVALYLPLFAWFSLCAGLAVRGRFRAVAVAIGGLAAWILVPLLLAALWNGLDGSPGLSEWEIPFRRASLAAWPVGLEEPDRFGDYLLHRFGLAQFTALAAAWYLFVLAAIRFWALRRADRWLGRA